MRNWLILSVAILLVWMRYEYYQYQKYHAMDMEEAGR